MAKTVSVWLKINGEMKIKALPAKFAVCHYCGGEGTTLAEGLKGEALTPEDFERDPDFTRAYVNGDYDVTCPDCLGLRVISVVDLEALSDSQRQQLAEADIELSNSFAESYGEEKWGC